jgi:glutaminyl-peptide cyclotransferase
MTRPWILFAATGIFCSGLLRAQVPSFNSGRSFADLERQCAFGPRVPGSKAHEDCLAFLSAALNRCTDRVVLQRFSAFDALQKKTVALTNVIASFGRRNDRILFCAHWDSRAFADSDPDPRNRTKAVPGANDGASGVAVLLEVGRVLAETPPSRGVDIVLFDGEDDGVDLTVDTWCLGARHFAGRKHPQYRPRYAVLLDMVGDRNLDLPVEANSRRFAPQVVDRVWGKARALGLAAFDGRDGFDVVDDHLELLKAGIPAVDVIDLDYPYWHTTADTPDQCSPESLWTVGSLILHLIYE